VPEKIQSFRDVIVIARLFHFIVCYRSWFCNVTITWLNTAIAMSSLKLPTNVRKMMIDVCGVKKELSFRACKLLY